MSKKAKNLISNSKLADSSSKIIFEDPLLCSQFLRDYVEDVPCLKHVQPEDIEDVSDRYVPLFAEERNSDRVKKVHIKNGTPFFLVSLIEHKTKVEYNVAMQIFRYMVYIWETYEKEEETKKPGISRQKSFRYPPILPIVYYEGRQAWTAPLDFKSRILEGEMFVRYIPDFHYHLVPLRRFSRQELLDKQDEISLIMLINKLQSLKDISSFRSLPADRLDAILKSSPDHIVDIIANILRAFLLRSNVPVDEAEEVVGKVKEKDMGLLFANMDPIDIPAEREKIKQERDTLRQEQEALQQEQEALQQEQEALQQKQEALQQKQEALQQERETFQHAQEAFAKEKRELAAAKKLLEDKLKELASR